MNPMGNREAGEQDNTPTLIRSTDHSEATERVLKIYRETLQATRIKLFGRVKEVVLC